MNINNKDNNKEGRNPHIPNQHSYVPSDHPHAPSDYPHVPSEHSVRLSPPSEGLGDVPISRPSRAVEGGRLSLPLKVSCHSDNGIERIEGSGERDSFI